MAIGFITVASPQTPGPSQPLPFSHRTHAGDLKLQCKMCHQDPGAGETMTIAAPSTCMQCHSAIKKDSPAIRKLAAFASEGKQVPWTPVYQLPDFVHFSHKTHLDAGAACSDCHGPVATRDVLSKEGDISMGGCMNCHRQKNVSIDCTFCHDQLN